jgi:hypothetical protein
VTSFSSTGLLEGRWSGTPSDYSSHANFDRIGGHASIGPKPAKQKYLQKVASALGRGYHFGTLQAGL